LYNKKEFDYKKENSFVPALINRLDRNTSGLVIAAKNSSSLNILNQKMHNHEINKYYLCIVHGYFDKKQGVLEDYLTKDAKNNFVKVTKKPINSSSVKIITQYSVLKSFQNKSLLEIKLITGKTHQIRAHMNFIGHPLVGEQKYKDSTTSNDEIKAQCLISYKVVFGNKGD
jgi:23S rRNA pseudouridine955/2504/2580 synthase